MTEETQLQFAVQPLSGPTRGGTSLQVTLHQPALAGMWALHLGGVPLNCTAAGSSTLRCCCTPTVDNSTRGSELVLYRSAASTSVFVWTLHLELLVRWILGPVSQSAGVAQ